MTDIRALTQRFDWMRDSGVCSPTTRGLLDDAQAALEAQDARIAEVLARHTLSRSDQSNGWTGDPFDECRECSRPWPCPTVRIIKGNPD